MFDWLKKLTGGGNEKSFPGSRQYAREILAQSWEAFRLARRDRPREHNQPHPYSGDAAILGSHDLMNRRVRDLVRNTSQGKRIRQAISDLVVGRGFQTFAWPFAPHELFEIVRELESVESGELGPRLSYALESDDLFEEWSSDPEQFDVEGRLSRMEMERMAIGETVVTGNALIIRSFSRNFKMVPLAYQIIEREQLDESADRPASRGRNKIVGGIELSANNRAAAYHVFLDHPHEFFGANQSALLGAGRVMAQGSRRMRIPAERVIDLALYDRPSSSLGVSWYDAVGSGLDDRDSYIDSEIRKAALQAAFVLVAKLMDPDVAADWGFADESKTDSVDDSGNQEIRLGHSPIAAQLAKDEEVDLVNADSPNSNAQSFLDLFDRDTAAGAGISWYTLTGNYEGTNFSSTRAAKLDEDLHVAPLQRWFGTHVAMRIRRDFNAVAAATGLIQSIRPSEFRSNTRRFQRFEAYGNGRDLLDPFKEGEARTTRLRTGISTFKEECAKRNIHWIRQLIQLAVEKRVSSMLDVFLDFSRSGSGNTSRDAGGNGQPASNQQAEEQAQDIAERVAMLLEN